MTEQQGGVVAPDPSAPAAIALLLGEVPGVAMLVPPRGQVRALLARAASAVAPRASEALGAASGGSAAEPVLVHLSADEVAVSVDVGIAAGASAPVVAGAVGGAAREWCLREHPGRRARVTVRVVAID